MGRAFRSAPRPDPTEQGAPGYASSGEGMWSRSAARDGFTLGLARQDRNPKRGVAGTLICKSRHQIEELRKRLPYLSTAKRKLAERDIGIKKRFIAKLRLELGGAS